ncbi:unnamed protein product [Staurois parvus]|uniref:Mitochondrial import receptor subunit TOM7 homolog n=1 Tax=Staurois parvus TaxID=386267 RepID=A0ABN9CT63_9NEOB|nr:unnamed protein product [Staurois parvus]
MPELTKESKQRLQKVFKCGQFTVRWGFVPLVLYLGQSLCVHRIAVLGEAEQSQVHMACPQHSSCLLSACICDLFIVPLECTQTSAFPYITSSMGLLHTSSTQLLSPLVWPPLTGEVPRGAPVLIP